MKKTFLLKYAGNSREVSTEDVSSASLSALFRQTFSDCFTTASTFTDAQLAFEVVTTAASAAPSSPGATATDSEAIATGVSSNTSSSDSKPKGIAKPVAESEVTDGCVVEVKLDLSQAPNPKRNRSWHQQKSPSRSRSPHRRKSRKRSRSRSRTRTRTRSRSPTKRSHRRTSSKRDHKLNSAFEEKKIATDEHKDAPAPAPVSPPAPVTTPAPVATPAPTNPESTPSVPLSSSSSSSRKRHKRDRDRPQDRYIVRIRGLPWECGETEVREFFDGLSILKEGGVNIVTSTDGHGPHTGQAFIEFEDPDSLVAAMAKRKEKIQSRWIEVYQATPGELEKAVVSRAVVNYAALGLPGKVPKNAASHVVKCRGLPWRATDQDVRSFFHDVEVDAVHFVLDPRGRNTGDAFIEVASDAQASLAMKHNKKYLGSRFVDIFRSDIPELINCCLNGGQGRAASTKQVDTVQSVSTAMRITGMPYGSSDEDVTTFFAAVGVTPARIHCKTDGSEAYVEFFTAMDCTRAMTRNKEYMGNRFVQLYRTSYNEMAQDIGLPLRPEMTPAAAAAAMMMPMGMMPPNPYAAYAAMSPAAGYAMPYGYPYPVAAGVAHPPGAVPSPAAAYGYPPPGAAYPPPGAVYPPPSAAHYPPHASAYPYYAQPPPPGGAGTAAAAAPAAYALPQSHYPPASSSAAAPAYPPPQPHYPPAASSAPPATSAAAASSAPSHYPPPASSAASPGSPDRPPRTAATHYVIGHPAPGSAAGSYTLLPAYGGATVAAASGASHAAAAPQAQAQGYP